MDIDTLEMSLINKSTYHRILNSKRQNTTVINTIFLIII